MVEASRDEASLAVRLYNDPAEVRSFEAFVVHMHLAWLYLLHAEFTRDGVDFRYRQRDNPRLLEKIDGEPKRWELAKSVRERWSNERDPIRANLEFFIGLRNKVEHRFAQRQQALSAVVGGQGQSLLLNYEEELVGQFGSAASLATRLRFPVFIGSFTDEGERSLRRLRKTLPAPLRNYITEYTANLEASVTEDPRFELRLRVFQELAPKSDPDALSVQFTRFDEMSPEQKIAVEEAGKKGLVVIKERKRNIAGLDELSPMQVVAAVQQRIPYRFTSDDFTRAWRKLGVRPPGGSPTPDRTLEQYCTYYQRHRDYGYKPAYVEKLVRECSSAEGFVELTGKPAKDKTTGEQVTASATEPPTVSGRVPAEPAPSEASA